MLRLTVHFFRQVNEIENLMDGAPSSWNDTKARVMSRVLRPERFANYSGKHD